MSCSQGKTIRPRSPLFFSLLAVNYSLTPPHPPPPEVRSWKRGTGNWKREAAGFAAKK